jgi:hypothetical protein
MTEDFCFQGVFQSGVFGGTLCFHVAPTNRKLRLAACIDQNTELQNIQGKSAKIKQQ